MAEKDSKVDVDSLIRKGGNEHALSPLDKGLSPLAGSLETAEKIKEEKLSILGKYQAGRIERKALVETIKNIHNAQAESTKHKLMRALEVDKQRVDLVAQRFIDELNQEYLHDMRVMGLKNFNERSEILTQLGKDVVKQVESAATIPSEVVRQKTIDGIFKKFEELQDKLMSDEFKLSQK